MTPYPPQTIDPVRWAIMRQEWNDLAFVHWPVPLESVQDRLPRGLYADRFEGHAWVGLVAFHMQRIGAAGISVPYLGTFPETNVRTYVRDAAGRPGVWFDSLDITRMLPVAVARITYGLPYMWSSMQIRRAADRRSYHCRRRWGGPSASSHLDITIGPEIAPTEVSPLERFLTCRWGLYSRSVGRVLYAPVEHPEWPLHRATLDHLDDTLTTVAGYPPPEAPPLVHWTRGVEVRIGRPRRAVLAERPALARSPAFAPGVPSWYAPGPPNP